MPDLVRRERTVRLLARTLGTAFVAFFLVFFAGEMLLPETDPESAESTDVALAWLDYAGLTLMGIGLVGFILAWWWPTAGGILALAGLTIPVGLSVSQIPVVGLMQLWWILTSPINLAIAAAIMHLVDGRWRKGGIGPPLGRVRAPPTA